MRGFRNAGGLVFLSVVALGCSAASDDSGSLGEGGSGTLGESGGGIGGTSMVGGANASSGGNAQGTGGNAQGTGGSAQGTGGNTQGTGGNKQGTGGNAQGSGGSAGTGGNTQGAGGAPNPPQTVLDCNGLAAQGTWENITPPDHDGTNFRSADFVVDPTKSGVVYLGTDSFNTPSKGVLKSTDCGASWTHVSTGQGSSAINNGRQWTFQISPQDSRVLYTNSGYNENGLWKSTNGGVDWLSVTAKTDGAPGFVGNLQMDPKNPDHLLQSWHGPCNGPNGQYQYADGVGCIHQSTDGGASWKGFYGSPNWPAEVRPLLLHDSTWLVLAQDVLRTTDGGKTFEVVAQGGLGGHSSGTLSRARNGDYYIGTQVGIFRSAAASDGKQWAQVGSAAWVGEIADTGSSLFATQQQNGFLKSSDGGANWSLVTNSAKNCERAKYDSGHHLLFASCGANGFWRAVQ